MTNQEVRFASGLYGSGSPVAFQNYLISKGATLQNFLYRMNQVNALDKKIALRAKNKRQAVMKQKAEAARMRGKANAIAGQAAILRAQNASPTNRVLKPLIVIGLFVTAIVWLFKRKKKSPVRKKRRK